MLLGVSSLDMSVLEPIQALHARHEIDSPSKARVDREHLGGGHRICKGDSHGRMESHKIQSGVTPGSIIKVDEAGDAPRGWIHEQMYGRWSCRINIAAKREQNRRPEGRRPEELRAGSERSADVTAA